MEAFNFTPRLREILALAEQESRRLSHEYVGTEHLLLSLMRHDDGVAATVLHDLAVDPTSVERLIEAVVRRGRTPSPERGPLPFTSRSKKVIELAISESRMLGHASVGTEHLLLGLLLEEKGIAAQVLADFGMRIPETRREVLKVLGTPVPSAPHAEVRQERARIATDMPGDEQNGNLARRQPSRIDITVGWTDGRASEQHFGSVEEAIAFLLSIGGETRPGV